MLGTWSAVVEVVFTRVSNQAIVCIAHRYHCPHEKLQRAKTKEPISHGHATVGFLNPTIYSIGLGSSYGADFHDITSGSNGTYSTIKGYDLVTGWGSPNGAALINALAP
jgi:hypothetical protein